MFLSKVLSKSNLTLGKASLMRFSPNVTNASTSTTFGKFALDSLAQRDYHHTSITSKKNNKKDSLKMPKKQTSNENTAREIAKVRYGHLIGAISHSELQEKIKKLTKPSTNNKAPKKNKTKKTSTKAKQKDKNRIIQSPDNSKKNKPSSKRNKSKSPKKGPAIK